MISNDLINYLKDKKFHSGLIIKVGKSPLISEHEYLKTISKGKDIIHFGFLDHPELIDKKVKSGKWLHGILLKVANFCVGLDINEEGIEYVKNNYGIDNVYVFNVFRDEIPLEIKSHSFDLMLIPQVVEHVGNPVEFLKILKKKFKSNVNRFIVTVPNAFRLDNWKYAFLNSEVINTDHRFWFTFYTISKICTDAGFEIENVVFVNHNPLPIDYADMFLLNEIPILRDTILLECR